VQLLLIYNLLGTGFLAAVAADRLFSPGLRQHLSANFSNELTSAAGQRCRKIHLAAGPLAERF
jgi:hypothetical protein